MMKAVLVDDEYYALQGLRMELEEIGGVTVAGMYVDGQSALVGIKNINPDVIFLDIEIKRLENLQLILYSAKRLSGLVNEILDFAKMENQDLQLNRKPVGIWQIAEVVLALLDPLAKAKQLALKNAIPENAPLLLADEDRLRQILQNLVGNAIKFSDAGEIVKTGKIISF